MKIIKLDVPVANFRQPDARSYWATYPTPPPSTCYGFLLSLVGERLTERHVGVRVTSGVMTRSNKSVMLKTVHRFKSFDPKERVKNTTPTYMEMLTNLEVVLFVDSSEEINDGPTLEERVVQAITHPETVDRWGCLHLGGTTSIIDDIRVYDELPEGSQPEVYCLSNASAYLTMPVWPDYNRVLETQWVRGKMIRMKTTPDVSTLPKILPPARTPKKPPRKVKV
jgi:CRISPR-associated protein Cas5t